MLGLSPRGPLMPPRKKKPEAGSIGLSVDEIATTKVPREIAEPGERARADGGALLASYRDPFAGRWLALVALPIERVKATPYQRELSKTHADRLAGVIPKVGRFLDPVIAIRQGDEYWTPNGM